MTARSISPALGDLDIAMDQWTQPFWDASARGELRVPRCSDCGTFRWPPGPFCPSCRSQATEWVSPGEGRLYSYTILPVRSADKDAPVRYTVPALVRFADAGGTILMGSLIDAPLDAIAIDAPVRADWLPATNATILAFRLA